MPLCLNFYRSLLIIAGIAAIALGPLDTSTNAQEADPAEEAVAVFNQAQDLHEKGDLAGALKLYERSLDILPEFPEAAYQRGSAQLSLGQAAEAEASFRRAVELRPEWSLALAALGSLLVNQEKYIEAEPVLTKALAIDELNFPALAAIAELRIKTGAKTSTIEMLLGQITDLTTKANPPVSILISRAALENHLGQRLAARTSINKALSLEPRNSNALIQSAEIALAGSDTKRAFADAVLLEKISPESDVHKLIRAEVLYIDGDTPGAMKLLETVTPARAATLRNRISIASSDPAQLEKRLAANEKDAAMLGQLCRLYRRENPEKALNYCRRASEVEPNNIHHAVGFSAALVEAKQFEAAVLVLKKLLAIAPENVTARGSLATALFQLKRYSDAKAELRWLTTAQPLTAQPFYFLGLAHEHLKEYADAIANYQQFLRLASDGPNKEEIETVNRKLPELESLMKKAIRDTKK